MRRAAIGVLALAALGAAVVHWAPRLLAPPASPSWYARTVYPLDHDDAIRAAARRNRLDPALVAAVIHVESRFDEHARSSQGAVGLMQVLPRTAEQIARETGGVTFVSGDLEDPRVNVRYGCYYLRYAFDVFDGDAIAAIASYNAGVGVVGEWAATAAAAGHHLRLVDIPYPETRAYVKRVFDARRVYRDTYAERLHLGGSSE